ncbi:MAG: hypothetical protein EBR82_67280 [Caulobacteraceae bacterium]|nr:hypothetical protein [Caulobacteraceae bacterium]
MRDFRQGRSYQKMKHKTALVFHSHLHRQKQLMLGLDFLLHLRRHLHQNQIRLNKQPRYYPAKVL